MAGWSQVSAAAGRGRMAVEYMDSGWRGAARFSSEEPGSRFEQRRRNRSLLELSGHLEEKVVPQAWMLSSLDDHAAGDGESGLTYLEVKGILERKLAFNKRGLLNQRELEDAVTEFKDMREESDLNAGAG